MSLAPACFFAHFLTNKITDPKTPSMASHAKQVKVSNVFIMFMCVHVMHV